MCSFVLRCYVVVSVGYLSFIAWFTCFPCWLSQTVLMNFDHSYSNKKLCPQDKTVRLYDNAAKSVGIKMAFLSRMFQQNHKKAFVVTCSSTWLSPNLFEDFCKYSLLIF